MPKGAGAKRKRVEYHSYSEVPNALGQMKPSYTPRFSCWAEVRTPNGREATNALQRKAELSHVVTVRYNSNNATISPKGRILYKGRVFNIESVINFDERNREIDLNCMEVVSPP